MLDVSPSHFNVHRERSTPYPSSTPYALALGLPLSQHHVPGWLSVRPRRQDCTPLSLPLARPYRQTVRALAASPAPHGLLPLRTPSGSSRRLGTMSLAVHCLLPPLPPPSHLSRPRPSTAGGRPNTSQPATRIGRVLPLPPRLAPNAPRRSRRPSGLVRPPTLLSATTPLMDRYPASTLPASVWWM